MKFCVWLLIAAAAGCEREAAAQQATADPTGPIRCFQAVTATGLSLDEDSAISLCAGAINAAPGECYATAINQFHELSSQQIDELCDGTTTMQPISCYANLSTRNDLSEGQIIAFCASRCAAGPPPPQTSSAACAQTAINGANISLQKAGQLCTGARSVGPALCYMAGDVTRLSGDKLINLCADTTHCQYPGSYGTAYGATGGAYGAPSAQATPVPRTPGY